MKKYHLGLLSFYYLLFFININPSWALLPKRGQTSDNFSRFTEDGLRFELLDSEVKRDELLKLFLSEDKNHLRYYWGQPLSPINDEFIKGNIQFMYDLTKDSMERFKSGEDDRMTKVEYLVYDEMGRLLGNVGLSNYGATDEGAISIYISSQFKGKNLGQRTTLALLQAARERFEMEHLYWECLASNTASSHLAKKAGLSHHITNILDSLRPDSEYGKEEVFKIKMK